ncbi:hypothetical protein BJ165DRAFT_931571 [Panaeolus papilionaceus]|nr:hypothetical protein BJ165DRAFT_931571 [Panaeolus papilionaceus]
MATLKECIVAAVDALPTFIEASLSTQPQKLILEPMSSLINADNEWKYPALLIIDELDKYRNPTAP